MEIRGTWLQYYLFRIASVALGWLPIPISYFVASVIAETIYILAVKTRNAVASNLRQVMGPYRSPQDIQVAVKGVFSTACKNYVDLLKVPFRDPAHLEEKLTISGLHHFQRALDEGRGVVLATAHFGNFDMVAQVMSQHYPGVTVLIEPLQPAPLFRLVKRLRESQGLDIRPVGIGSLKSVIHRLRRGGIAVIACDRDIGKNGLRTPFFGRVSTLPTGAADLALRTGAVLLPIFSVRHADDRWVVYIEPPISTNSATNRQEAMEHCVAQVKCAMESYIRRYPHQWVVFDPLWGDGAREG
ncbi:MAG: hypothetical protein HYU86_09805 [Chloroflexi bacterium]|nr:hypothetical protein [Chloroflexota bacterium]